MPAKIDDGLTNWQRYKLRHPEKWNKIKSVNQKRKWSSMTKEERTARHLWKRYKITLEQWRAMFDAQDHKCAICSLEIHDIAGENDKDRGVVDHCHETGQIRGILCHHCNRALGLMKDNKMNIQKMLEYLS